MAEVIDRQCTANHVARERLEFVKMVIPWIPDHCLNVQNLRGSTIGIDGGGLCPADHLAPVINCGGVGIVASQCGQGNLHPIYPQKSAEN